MRHLQSKTFVPAFYVEPFVRITAIEDGLVLQVNLHMERRVERKESERVSKELLGGREAE